MSVFRGFREGGHIKAWLLKKVIEWGVCVL